jgi:hypothetical protein
MEAKLTNLSPVSFMETKEGDVLDIRRVSPRAGEVRAKTPALQGGAFLVFKGKTKVGQIPPNTVDEHGAKALGVQCLVVRVDKSTSTIVVKL